MEKLLGFEIMNERERGSEEWCRGSLSSIIQHLTHVVFNLSLHYLLILNILNIYFH